jgi:hypothetical protein
LSRAGLERGDRYKQHDYEETIMTTLRLIGVFLLPLLLQPSPSHAQSGGAIRVWVSGVGENNNSCSRTAPCRSFAAAIQRVAPGGEISVLDSGDFGSVTITRSLSIVNETREAGLMATPGMAGITINAGPSDVVVLRGLVIDGNLGQGTSGIVFNSGAALTVDKSVIKNFAIAGGNGINFIPNGPAELFVSDTVIINNGLVSAGNGAGITIDPSGGSANVTLTRVQLENNRNGLWVDSVGTSGQPINVAVHDSTIVGNQVNGIRAAGSSQMNVLVNRSVVAQNGTAILTAGNVAAIRIGSSVVTGNTTVLTAPNSATVLTYSDNMINTNTNVNTPPIAKTVTPN